MEIMKCSFRRLLAKTNLTCFAVAALAIPATALAQYPSYPTTPSYPAPPSYPTQGNVYNGNVYNGNVYVPPTGQPIYNPGLPSTALPNSTIRPNGTQALTASSMVRPWYANLTQDRDHDFGTVPFASTQEHTFEFTNNTGADLFLTYVKASCGCTKPTILTPQVKPNETAKIKAEFDTKNFYGARGATLTVSMNKAGTNEYGELQLSVKGLIRRDVVLNPGEIDFQNVSISDAVQKTVRVLYAGRPDWAIQEVTSTNPNISAEVREIERNQATGRTSYEMIVSLNQNQPTGPFMETLTIVTNDAKTTNMPVRVGGNVKPLIDVAPINLGVVNKGQTITKKLIVRSPQAISIERIETGNDKIKFAETEGKKTLHILTYTLDTSEPVEIARSIKIVTKDDVTRETEVPFSVQIVPSTITSDKEGVAQQPNGN